jgi:hypothetical protein
MPEEDVQAGSSQPEEEVVIEEEVITTPPAPITKGAQTPPENLYKALEEERRKRKELEDKLNSIPQTPAPTDEVFSDEGRLLDSKISELNSKLRLIEEKEELGKVYAEYPVLKEAGSDFDTFRADYHDYKIGDVAKLFIMEKGLAETKSRKGLVKSSGGGQTVPTEGYTAEQLADLRKNNHRKYMEVLKGDKVNFAELK